MKKSMLGKKNPSPKSGLSYGKILLTLALCILVSCKAYDEARLKAADLVSLEKLRLRFIDLFNEQDTEGLAKLYSEDAVQILPRDGIKIGRQAILGSFKAFFAISKPRIRINYAGTKTVDEWAFDRWEQWLMISNASGPKTVFRANGIRIYKKTEGDWKIYWSIQTDDELVGSQKTSIADKIEK